MKKRLKPFHQAIVDIINDASFDNLPTIEKIIKSTRITENHDAIRSAWEKCIYAFYAHGGSAGEEGLEASKSILEQQKRELKKQNSPKAIAKYGQVLKALSFCNARLSWLADSYKGMRKILKNGLK